MSEIGLEIHHGGLLDLDHNLGKKVGTYNIYFLVPDRDLDDGLRILNGDIDVMDINYLVGNVSLTNVEVFNGMQMGMGAISEESTDGEKNESDRDDARIILTKDIPYFNDGDNSDDECTTMRKLKAKSLSLFGPSNTKEKTVLNHDENNNSSSDVHNMNSPLNSDGECGGRNFSIVDENRDLCDLQLKITAVCADDCPWRIHASEMQGSKTFQIKTITKHILHPRRYRMKAVTSTWLAYKYMGKLTDDPKIKVKAIIRLQTLIGLDACHLKGPYGEQMICAISRDGNKQMYPLAMAVVEAECKDS
ncbi:hypothetical protein ACH5RR_028842 [Cinchona calisaya]|uniref:Transposase MuDR plant domain-containing protein n=1 Tax=Cinchona calisaya TaxID=153742 RepID=A0ABD2YS54_9GENT